MGLLEQIRNIVSTSGSDDCFNMSVDSEGVNFFVQQSKYELCEVGNAPKWIQHQFIYLKMLEEQGIAEAFPNGFIVSATDYVEFEREAYELLNLPPHFPGNYAAQISGVTTEHNFDVQLVPIGTLGRPYPMYSLDGPILVISDDERYSLTAPEYGAFQALDNYQRIKSTSRGEAANIMLVHELQQANLLGMPVDLKQFGDLTIEKPKSVGVNILPLDDGSAVLVPNYGEGVDPEAIDRTLGQLGVSSQEAVLRAGNRIVILDEERLKATREIVENRVIPADQFATFLKAPSAFLDATLVDLDLGFSQRVQGVTEFKHGYFGETDESGIDWFLPSGERVYPPSCLKGVAGDGEDLESIRRKIAEATKAGASVIEFGGEIFDISNPEVVDDVLKGIEIGLPLVDPETVSTANDPDGTEDPPRSVVIDIDLNDEDARYSVDKSIAEVSYTGEIDFGAYKRQPYSYQEAGIRWILGLAEGTQSLDEARSGRHGALLADDMGLGKTYMSLVAVSEYQRLARISGATERPVLVVAPLSLLENWKDEADKTFLDSPFENNIVILQSDADLKKYKKAGSGVETRQSEMELDKIRYALKVGQEFGTERLDLPRRLVLTTYQTLRDYQFSLSRVDWSFVIFDEAQFIKNPNTLATRAAKALKARFKLLATGTPVENSLADFWCIMDTAAPGYLGSYQDFRQEYIKPITAANDADKPGIRSDIGKKLRLQAGNLMLRRVKADQLEGLPSKTIFVGDDRPNSEAEFLSTLQCVMPNTQMQRYNAVIRLVAEEQLEPEGGSPVLAGLHRLRDVSLHPLLLDGGLIPIPTDAEEARALVSQSGKLKQTFRVLEQIQSRGEKVIVFAINKRLQSFLKMACERVFGVSVSIINGDTKAVAKNAKTPTRKNLIASFEKSPGFGVIVMSPVAAGMGLTVVGANNVIHLERHWNPAKEAQATDRVYRIGQTRDVNVYLPILQHPEEGVASFDVNLNRLLSQKSALRDAVVTPEVVDPDLIGGSIFGGTFSGDIEKEYISPSSLETFSWQQFEAFAAELIAESIGGDAVLTQEGNDDGADAIVWSENGNVLIQAKHSATYGVISEDAAGQVYRAKPIYEDKTIRKYDRLISITNAKSYSSKVKDSAKSYGVELIARKDIEKLLKTYPIEMVRVMRRLNKARLAVR